MRKCFFFVQFPPVLLTREVPKKGLEMSGGTARCMQSQVTVADNALHAPHPTLRRSMRLKGTSAGVQPPEGTSQKGKKGSAWAINPVLKTLLLGTACPSSPLRHLSVRMKLQNINL